MGTMSPAITGVLIVLEGKKYAISQDSSAITEGIFDIYRILKALYQIMIDLID